MAAFANVIANAFRNCSFVGAVERPGKERVLGVDNSSKAVQERAGMFRYDEWGHFCFEKIDASSFGGWIQIPLNS